VLRAEPGLRQRPKSAGRLLRKSRPPNTGAALNIPRNHVAQIRVESSHEDCILLYVKC
jgi:hypothetical protein